MEKRIRDYFKYTLEELENYTELGETCVKKVTSNRNIIFPLLGRLNIHETLLKMFSKKKIRFDPELQAIILEITNIKVLSKKAITHSNTVYIHTDTQADFYIFQPTIGSVVKGVIKHLSDQQIVVVIYRVFSVTIKLKEKTKRKLEINSEIEIRIKNFDLENLPYIEGELILSRDSCDEEIDKLRNKALCPAVNLNESSDEDDSEDEGDTQINRYKNPAVLNESQQIAHKAVPNSEMTGKTTFEISSSDDMSSDENTARVQSNKKNLVNLSATSKHESENTTGSDTDDEDEGDDRSHTVTALHKNLDRNAKKITDEDLTFQNSSNAEEVSSVGDISLQNSNDNASSETEFHKHPTQRKRKMRTSSKLEEQMDEAYNVMKRAVEKKKDMFDCFGEFIAHSLRNLEDPQLQTMTKHKITDAIQMAEMQKLQRLGNLTGVYPYNNSLSTPSFSRSSIPHFITNNPTQTRTPTPISLDVNNSQPPNYTIPYHNYDNTNSETDKLQY